MEKDEKIIFKFKGPGKHLPRIDKKIKYYFIATEPDYNIYDIYPDEIEGDNDENNFKKEEYIGRLSYYNIKSDTEFNFECEDNCLLCKKDPPNSCISCKYGYTLSEGNNKSCKEKETELIIETTEMLTEKITEKPTESRNQILTELITEKKTEHISEIITEQINQITEKITEQITELKSEKITEIITELITEKITEKSPEQLTEKITDEITEYKKEEITEVKVEEAKNEGNICSMEKILNNKCDEGRVNQSQISQVYTQLKDNYIYNFKGNNTIIQTQNVVFQISSLEDQKKSDNPNVSSIDLGECEEKLKKKFGIEEDLIIFKTDIKSEDLTQTYVQYEVYDPINLKPLNLSICKDTKISISTPVKLGRATSNLYDNLKESGYDLFNESDAFYTDICSTYTSENGTDMTLEDRKKEIFSNNGNLSLCQSGCDLEFYNSTSKKAKCKCFPQIEETKPILSSSLDKFNIKKLSDNFMNTLKNSNFLVLKCYKLAIDLKTIRINIGRIFMTIILVLSLFMLFVFCITCNNKIDNYLKSILQYRINYINNNYNTKLNNKKNNNIKEKRNENKKNNKLNKNNQNTKNILNKFDILLLSIIEIFYIKNK